MCLHKRKQWCIFSVAPLGIYLQPAMEPLLAPQLRPSIWHDSSSALGPPAEGPHFECPADQTTLLNWQTTPPLRVLGEGAVHIDLWYVIQGGVCLATPAPLPAPSSPPLYPIETVVCYRGLGSPPGWVACGCPPPTRDILISQPPFNALHIQMHSLV